VAVDSVRFHQDHLAHPSDKPLVNEGEANMNTTLERKLAKSKPTRKLLFTLAVSAPIIFWIASLFS
jgi:hypothetical protein